MAHKDKQAKKKKHCMQRGTLEPGKSGTIQCIALPHKTQRNKGPFKLFKKLSLNMSLQEASPISYRNPLPQFIAKKSPHIVPSLC